jgi:hypothetical protein
MLALLFAAIFCCAATNAAAEHQHTCLHGTRGNELTAGVRLTGGTGQPVKRGSQQPIRFSMFPDSTITDDLPPSKRELIMEVIQSLLDFFSDFVSVVPAQSPILLDRTCTGGFFLPEEGSTVRQCVNTCVTSVCGTVTIPSDHLKVCTLYVSGAHDVCTCT